MLHLDQLSSLQENACEMYRRAAVLKSARVQGPAEHHAYHAEPTRVRDVFAVRDPTKHTRRYYRVRARRPRGSGIEVTCILRDVNPN